MDPGSDPDHSIFTNDANRKLIKKSFSACYSFKVLLHHFVLFLLNDRRDPDPEPDPNPDPYL
jgi:hypothetical protein